MNFFLNRIADPLQRELGERYDPWFTVTDAEPSPFDEIGILQLVRSWRQMAWQNAELLVNAADEAQRRQAADWIEAYSTAAAEGILAANTVPGYGKVRDEWCAEHNPDSANLRAAGPAKGRRLPVSVYADGPAKFEVGAILHGGARRGGGKVTVARPVEVDFGAEGWKETTLRLTRRGRRALARARSGEVTLRLRAPYGFAVNARESLY